MNYKFNINEMTAIFNATHNAYLIACDCDPSDVADVLPHQMMRMIINHAKKIGITVTLTTTTTDLKPYNESYDYIYLVNNILTDKVHLTYVDSLVDGGFEFFTVEHQTITIKILKSQYDMMRNDTRINSEYNVNNWEVVNKP